MPKPQIRFVARPIINPQTGTEQSHGKAVLYADAVSLHKFLDKIASVVEPNRTYNVYQVNAPVGPNRFLFLTQYKLDTANQH